MCGIVGIYSFKTDKKIDTDAVNKMRGYLAHRGPDDSGVYLSSDQRFILGHTRLSIIDLSYAGHQPMPNQDGRVWISYNGEIYNYRQLQKELKTGGYEFRSNSDTEVIIHGYEEWGIDKLLEKLRGMFAFVIYDLRKRNPKLILARDRFGIKPLYYYQDDELLIFSSEAGAIVRSGLISTEKNKEAEISFLIFGNIPAPLTTINNIFSLPAGSYLSIENGNKKTVKYYSLIDTFIKPKIKNSSDIYQILFSILSETVDMHLISDAPLGVFLSGGIDSSALVALASRNRPLTTLSIIFDEKAYSELPYQRMIADKYKTNHHQVKITEKDFYDELDNIFVAMDQPTVDGVNTYFVSRAAKQIGLKTVLSGTGGDEIFCGYESFKKIELLKTMQGIIKLLRFPFCWAGNLNDRWRKLSYFQGGGPLGLYIAIRGLFAPTDIAGILDISEKEVCDVIRKITFTPYPLSLNPIDWLSYMEMSFYLQNQLLKDTDTMSMYHSVETRVPYLDHILVDYIVSISSSLKVNRSIPKPLLAKSLKNILPEEIIFRKKQGFAFPFDSWIRKKGRQLFEEAVAKSNINKQYAKCLWHRFGQKHIHWSKVWAVVVLGYGLKVKSKDYGLLS